MALYVYKLEVGPDPVRLNSPSEPHRPDRLWISNVEAQESDRNEIWLGPEDVTPRIGVYLDRGESPFYIETGPDEELYAVAEEGENTVEIRVLCSVV